MRPATTDGCGRGGWGRSWPRLTGLLPRSDGGQRCPGGLTTGASPRQSLLAKPPVARGSAPATAVAGQQCHLLASTAKPAVFLDKDGTLVEDVPYNVEPRLMRLAPRAGEALRLLAPHYRLVVISNQSGVARGYFLEAALGGVELRLRQLLAACGVELAGFYYCPHHPQGQVAAYRLACDCRKPRPGMLLAAAREHNLNLRQSWMVGDILDDVEAGRRAGCRTVLVDNGGETEWRTSADRQPDFTAGDLYEAAEWILQNLGVSILDGGLPPIENPESKTQNRVVLPDMRLDEGSAA